MIWSTDTPRCATGFASCGSIFDAARLKRELAVIEEKIADPTMWADAARVQPLMRERKRLETLLADDAELARRTNDIEAYFELAREGEATEPDLEREIPALIEFSEKLESKTMLSGETDPLNAIVTVHPGAGGTESQDWAEMLMRMYLRWAERQGFRTEINEIQDGDEAGIKSATFTITGDFAYGLLSGETGVHRLVRISPFDSAKRRHTSFASVFVSPGDRRHHRHRHQDRRPPHRHLSLWRQRRAACEHHRLRRAHHPHSDRPRDRLPERALPA
jgi:peptide chain release factor 2